MSLLHQLISMRAIHIKPPRKRKIVTPRLRVFLQSSLTNFFLGKICFLFKRCAFVFYYCHLLLLLWVSKRPFITSNVCKEAINIRSRLQSFKKMWLLDSTVNWDSHQTKLRNLSTVLEKGKVLSQRKTLFQLILFTERRHVRMAHL